MLKHQKLPLIFIYSVLVFIWATTPLAVVWSVQEIYPIWALIFRYIFASILSLIILLILKEKLPLDKWSIKSYLAGSLNIIAAQMLIYYAANYLTSGFMVLCYGFSPLITGLMGYFIFKTQKLNWVQWLGMLCAVSGLVYIFADQTQTHIQPIGLVLIFASIFCYVSSIFLVKKVNAPVSALAQTVGALLISTVGSLFFVPFIYTEFPAHLPQMRSLIGFGYTVIFSSIVAVFCYFWLIQRIKASTVAMSNIITPIIALIVGAWLNQEYLNFNAIVGVMIAMSGIALYFYAEKRKS